MKAKTTGEMVICDDIDNISGFACQKEKGHIGNHQYIKYINVKWGTFDES
jgi:hypothetical protein